ncbi:MAG: hypothetical protein GY804_07775 [Alphaproteobacteria bacterium]|nr:hypothetical protein [Alphaproteobacteria bacterium]
MRNVLLFTIFVVFCAFSNKAVSGAAEKNNYDEILEKKSELLWNAMDCQTDGDCKEAYFDGLCCYYIINKAKEKELRKQIKELLPSDYEEVCDCYALNPVVAVCKDGRCVEAEVQ